MLREDQSFRSQPVQVGRMEFLLSQTAQVSIAQVVSNDVNDIGKSFFRDMLGASEKDGQQDGGK